MKRIALSILALALLGGAMPRAQDAPPAPSAARTLDIHLHSLSRGYLRPLGATVERVAALPGFSDVQSLGFGGDVLRLRVTTTLGDDAIAKAFKLSKVGGTSGKLLLAADTSKRVQRAEARALLLDITRVLNGHPKPDWRNPGKPILGEAKGFPEQMKVLGLDPKVADGVFYKAADYHIEENHDRYSATYKLWAGKEWVPAVQDDEWGWSPRREEGAKVDDRFVGLSVTRSAWQDRTIWVDADGARMNNFSGERAETERDGRLKVQAGADWMTKVLSRALAVRLANPGNDLANLPKGRGWGLFNGMEANELQRWGGESYDNNCLEMSWSTRDSDKHVICKLTAFHDGHPLFLHAEVDSDALREAYAERKQPTKDIKDAELGSALVWVVGPEAGPEVFAQRKAEAFAATAALLEALGKLPADKPMAGFAGALTDEKATVLGVQLKGTHFSARDYMVTIQAFGDVEISAGTPMTGGRWWLLGNPATGKVLRSDR